MLRLSLNRDWQFWRADSATEKLNINLPHDAMLMETRQPDLENGGATGYFPGGRYVYSRSLYGKPEWADKTILVEFEGVYMNSKVYLNGDKIGGWIYGYTPFTVDLSGRLLIGQENDLRVEVDNSQTPNSRWYSGSGIYRPVNLLVGERNFIRPGGIKVTTVSIDPAEIEVQVDAIAEAGIDVEIDIMFNGNQVWRGFGDSARIVVPGAQLWDDLHPALYDLYVRLMKDGKIIDQDQTRFGLRQITWRADSGLMINGRTVKLRGGCVHHDHGPLGACSFPKAEWRRVVKLKEMGFNAIRYAHNPSNRAFLDACDELGVYVLEETFDQWRLPQSKYDYARYFEQEWRKDVQALVRQDFNHPSVIMYCIGNEISDTGLPTGGPISQAICELFHSLDPTRPTTIAINALLSTLAAKMAGQKDDKTAGSSDVNDLMTILPKIRASITAQSIEALIRDSIRPVDIVGYNYGENLYDGIHELEPDRVLLSSETFPRSIGQNWPEVEKRPYLIGDFSWTAWDYLGETGVGLPVYGTKQGAFTKPYPCISAGCGSFDLTGFAESQAYYTAVVWGIRHTPYIAVRPVDHAGEDCFLGLWRLTDAISSWTWPGHEGKTTQVEVYSQGTTVELLQDGVSIGRKDLEFCKAVFDAVYRPGSLQAISYNLDGSRLSDSQLQSAGRETKLLITPEEVNIRADGDDLAFVSVSVADESDVVRTIPEKLIKISIEGAGELAAVGSGNPVTEESFQGNSFTTYHGRMLAIVRSNGSSGAISILAESDGLSSVSAVITAK